MGLRGQEVSNQDLADCSWCPPGQCFSLAAVLRLHHLSAALIKREREAPSTFDHISLLKHNLTFTCVASNNAKLKILAALLLDSTKNLEEVHRF